MEPIQSILEETQRIERALNQIDLGGGTSEHTGKISDEVYKTLK